jgi:AcrR family transcriptional regulator
MRKKDDEKEKSIKEAVIKLILEEGFHGTSISKIAKMAGVSPATVYIYFENKENMLQNIYQEYSEEIYDYISSRVKMGMCGKEILEMLIRSYYNYICENEEIFNFVDQFSSCRSLACGCSKAKGICNINDLIIELKNKHIIKQYNIENLVALYFILLRQLQLIIINLRTKKMFYY